MKKNYIKIDYIKGEEPIFRYRSGLMVYEEKFTHGMLVPCGWNGAGYPLDVLQYYPSRLDSSIRQEPSAFNIELDGQSIDFKLKLIDFTIENDGDSATGILTLESEIKKARVRIFTTIDGTQMLTRYFEIENLSSDEMNLSRLSLVSGALEHIDSDKFEMNIPNEKYYSAGYFRNTRWGQEGCFEWSDVSPDTLVIDTRYGRDRFRHPLLFIRNNISGMLYFMQIAYSGGCRFSIDYDSDKERTDADIAVVAEITSYNPLVKIKAHSVFRTPGIHMGALIGSLDDAVNEMNAHARKIMPETSLLVGFGMGAEHDMSVETTKDYMRKAAQLGAEVFLVDAGWYCPVGMPIDWSGYCSDNYPHPDRYPEGIREISDYCHELGMKFCLWTDIENIGALAKLHAEKEHWRAKDIFGNRAHSFIDLSSPEVAKWCEDELARMIEEYNMDMLRVDNNGSCRWYFGIGDDGECLSLRRFDAVYKMYKNLRERFPHVIFENCAGGGGRTDWGIMKSFSHTWVSDMQRAPRSVGITNAMTLALPPEKVDRLFAGMGCHEYGSTALHMRNTMLGHMSLNTISPAGIEMNELQADFVKHSVDVYKNFIRDFLPKSKIYHHTPSSSETLAKGFAALEITAEDKTRGAIGMFTLSAPSSEVFNVVPRGIDMGKTYIVTLDNSGEEYEISARQLVTHGITVRIPAALSSELVLYREK